MDQEILSGTRDELTSSIEPVSTSPAAADVDIALRTAFEERLTAFIRRRLKLGEDVPIPVDADLAEQIGLDSIEAFDAVATLHEAMGVSIPDDFNPRTVSTLRNLSDYVLRTLGADAARRFLAIDIDAVDLDQAEGV